MYSLSEDQFEGHCSNELLPLASFNHVSRETLSANNSRRFYCDILGFNEIPRPPLECGGYWLTGYGLNLHLVQSRDPIERQEVLSLRIKHFSKALPRVDHIAFVTNNLSLIQKRLDDSNVYYKASSPPNTNIQQIFFFDPDGNVIEVSNCAPPIGQTLCDPNQPTDTFHQAENNSFNA